MKKLNVSLVGCGRIFKNHLSAIQNNSKLINLDSICDVDDDIISNINSDNTFLKFSNLDDCIKNTNSHLYVLSTPSGLHPKQSIQILSNNKNVLTEKPVSTFFEDHDHFKQIIKSSNSRFFTVLQNRFNSTIQLIKKLIDDEALGKIYQTVVNVFWTRPQGYYDLADWRGTLKMDGGAFLNQASHYFDLVYYLLGDQKYLYSNIKRLARNIEAEDSGTAFFSSSKSDLVNINVSMLAYPKNIEGSITIIAEKGTIKLGGQALNQFEIFEVENFKADYKQYNYQIPNIYGYGHIELYKHIYDAIINNKISHLEGLSGFGSYEMIYECYQNSDIYNRM